MDQVGDLGGDSRRREPFPRGSVAVQHVRTSTEVAATIRVLLDSSRRQAGGTELRALYERVQVAGHS